MEEIICTKKMLLNAYNKHQALGKLNNSIRKGQGNFDGFVGENALKLFLDLPLDLEQNTYDYDVVYHKKTIDVKTKKTSVIPQPIYEASVAAYNTKQLCDFYVFTRILYHENGYIPKIAYLMGFMPKQEYYSKARFLKKGQTDGSNNFIVKADCYNMFYKDMYPISDLLKLQQVV